MEQRIVYLEPEKAEQEQPYWQKNKDLMFLSPILARSRILTKKSCLIMKLNGKKANIPKGIS